MKNSPDENFERRLIELARKMDYPATPEVSAAIRRGRPARIPPGLAWAAAALIVIVAIVFTVPAARAEVLKFFRIGAVDIVPFAPTGSPRPEGSDPAPHLNGLTTLERARRDAGFAVLLPSYPPDLGDPDRVYLQPDEPVLVMLWFDPANPDSIRISLQEIGLGAMTVRKFAPQVIQETQVNGQHAIWTQGPYLLQMEGGDYDSLQLVQGDVLVWSANAITYRLESGTSLDEALRIAESLR